MQVNPLGIRESNERAAWVAGQYPDLKWCPSCREWTVPYSEKDEDGFWGDYCEVCDDPNLMDHPHEHAEYLYGEDR